MITLGNTQYQTLRGNESVRQRTQVITRSV
jgi:hypothetical protein